MNPIKAARELGKAIQGDERYISYNKAKEANDADENLQNLIGEFNLARQNLTLNMNLPEGEKDASKIDEFNKKAGDLHSQIMENENMRLFAEAKAEMDKMMQEVSLVISACCDGEDPDAYEVPQCSGNSGGCAGCSGCG